MTIEQLQAAFKNLGKLVFIRQQAQAASTALAEAAANMDTQAAGSDLSTRRYRNRLNNAMVTEAKDLSGKLDNLAAFAADTAEKYLRRCVAVDLGLSVGASLASVGAALTAAFVGASGYVGASGEAYVGASGFVEFFADYDIDLPAAEGETSPNVLNDWVTAVVVE